MFANLKDLFEAKGTVCDTGACEAAKGCCPEPACAVACEKPCKAKRCHKLLGEKGCCPEVAACEKVAACEPACEKVCEPKCHKLYRRPVLELLECLFGEPCNKCGNACGGGCEAACAAGCDGAKAAPAAAPAPAPAKAKEQAAPLPKAAPPKPDPSASLQRTGIYEASRSLVRN
jgi:hypothetical protein